MMKVKKVEIISGVYEYDVSKRVEEFIKPRDLDVIDIQFSTNGENQVSTVYSVMIIYRE